MALFILLMVVCHFRKPSTAFLAATISLLFCLGLQDRFLVSSVFDVQPKSSPKPFAQGAMNNQDLDRKYFLLSLHPIKAARAGVPGSSPPFSWSRIAVW